MRCPQAAAPRPSRYQRYVRYFFFLMGRRALWR
jgi:hypothetical protein